MNTNGGQCVPSTDGATEMYQMVLLLPQDSMLLRLIFSVLFDTNTVVQKLDGITNGLSDGFYAVNTGMLGGFNGIQRDLCTGFNAVNNGITESRFAAQQCSAKRNIDNVL